MGGLLAVVLVIALVAALSNGRVWAVVAGVFGTLLLVVGGLLLAGAWIFTVRSGVGRVEVADVLVKTEAPRPQVADPPDVSDHSLLDGGGKVVLGTEEADAPSGPPRPAWMDAQQGLVDGVYRTTVKVGPMFSRTECEQQLPEALRLAVRTYADHFLGEGKGQYVDLPMSYIRNHLVRGEWEERRQHTFDTMITLHELLQFDADANDAIEANYKQSVVMVRLGYTAAGGGVLLGLLTVIFGYLKLDTLTRGYYTGRLRLTATAAILALAAVAGLLVMA
ncbi:MAG: hypothetical protein ACREHD_12790 [Pirellulales bacterium]